MAVFSGVFNEGSRKITWRSCNSDWDPQAISFWDSYFCSKSKVFLSAEYSRNSEYLENHLKNNGQKVKDWKVLLLNPSKTFV